MNNLVNALTSVIKSSITALESHLSADQKSLVEFELTSFLLSRVDLSKFVGSMSPQIYAAFAAAMAAHADKSAS